ncbi:MAG: hypothetical protein H7Z14_11305 [Anaerolineae bacterium]|nr:hypothetical protein [Phycisphaerae bacterium]
MSATLESLEARRLLAGTASISGSVYTDLNANAKHEAGEAGMKKVRVYLDANNNGVLDRTETSTVTDKRGQFAFTGLNAGTHRLREVAAAGYRVVGPRAQWFKITLAEGQHVARRQFANAPTPRGGIVSGGTTQSSAANAKPVNHDLGQLGSTDFHGVGNSHDYSRVDSGFSIIPTGAFSGDFDYNGSVNFDDYALIDQAFNTQGSTLLRPPVTTRPTVINLRPTPTPAPAPTRALTAKEQAAADVATNVTNKTLANAVSWLSGNKNVAKSTGVQSVIDHSQKMGIEYKREFLKIANS